MKDKNGIEIKTGMIVKISGAYFKNDNGLYYVDNSPGDPSWSGRDYSLHKISKAGKISTAKRQITLRCVRLDVTKVEDCQFIASWAAWLYRKRDSGAGLPDMLREELRAQANKLQIW